MTDTMTPDSLRPGDLVGPWRVEGYAGRGSYGAVYRARRAGQPHSEWVVPPNTREYRSPESLRFEWTHWRKHGALYETRPADDVYALGVAEYRLVTGVYPPPGTDPDALKEQLQVPLPLRRLVHEFNRRVVPEVSALIERMLAKEPETRATAREVAEAAESAAKRMRSEADVPFLDLEWPKPKVQAVPVRVRSEPHAPSPESRVRAVVILGGLVLFMVAIVCRGPASQPEMPAMAQVEVPGAESAPDGGTRGIGDDSLTTREDSQGVPVAPESVSQEVPPQPLPGQHRPPCRRRGEVVINGGCWVHQTNIEPPCGEEEYEWQGACYRASGVQSRKPTSKQPR